LVADAQALTGGELGETLPRADLRWKNNSLDPQALVKLLSVMCFPKDVRRRKGVLRQLPASLTIPRQSGVPIALVRKVAAEVRQATNLDPARCDAPNSGKVADARS